MRKKAVKNLNSIIEKNTSRIEAIDNMFQQKKDNPSTMPFKHIILCDMNGVPVFTEYLYEGEGIIKEAVFRFLSELKKDSQVKIESAQKELDKLSK